MIALRPDFPARAGELIRRSAKVEAFIEDLVDGLRRARMAVADD